MCECGEMNRKKMLFKVGLTVIILTAWYMYYAINRLETETQADRIVYSPREGDKNGEPDVSQYNQDEEKEVPDGQKISKENIERPKLRHESSHWKEGLHLSVVSCGDRMEESLVLLKSAVLFSKSKLVFHIFADEGSQKGFKEQLDFWPPQFQTLVQYYIYNLSFPAVENKKDDWQALFKPCAAQRLFIPDLLYDVDSLLYLDTDVILLSPVDTIWALFSNFNSTQMAGLAPEHEDKHTGWYNRFARHPFYGELGVNSGVMLMNLTRIRASSWLQSLKNFYKEYRLKITFGDQDLINIYFHFHPGELYVFPCEWNYRPDHCMYMSVCRAAEKTGAYILHGSRRVWHNDKQPAFRELYRVFKQHRLGASLQYELLENLKKAIGGSAPSNCGKLQNIFTRQIELHINSDQSDER